MTRSDSIAELVKAFAKAQASFPNIPKDREAIIRKRDGGEYRYRYADLGTILRAVTPHLTANGLVFVQEAQPQPELALVQINSLLAHTSGEWLASELVMRCADNEPRAVASVITYGRRYATSLLGISPLEDDDAEAASATLPSHVASTPPARAAESASSVPNEGRSSGHLYVRELRNGRAGAIGAVVLSDGRDLLFYKPTLAPIAIRAVKDDCPVELVTKRSASGNEYIVDLSLLPSDDEEIDDATTEVDGDSEPLTKDDIPF